MPPKQDDVPEKKNEWSDENTEIFFNVCIEEVCVGNRPHTHFNKIGWANVMEKFNKATKLEHGYKQFKNRWDNLKNEWKLWAKHVGRETGLGWDAAKGTIDASDEWWEAKIQEDSEVAKFRKQGPKHLHKLEILFRGIVAASFAAYAPSEDSRESEGLNTGVKGIYVDDIDNDDIEEQERVHEIEMGVTTQPTSSSKEKGQRKKGREWEKRGRAAAKLSVQLDRVIDGFESSSANYGSTDDATRIKACVGKLKNLPGLELGSELFFTGTRLMNKKANRLAFIALEEPALQLGWIKSHTWADVC